MTSRAPVKWNNFDYSILKNIKGKKRPTRYSKIYADCLAAADTETSKIKPNTIGENMIVCWSFAILLQDTIHVVYGRKPTEFCQFLHQCCEFLNNKTLIVYFHNLAYDYVFLRKFLFKEFGTPTHQLATKPHYPIQVSFKRFEIRDSLILAQRNLSKWADDMAAEHRKASGYWDYEKIRDQNSPISDDEMIYISNDGIALIECLEKTCKELHRPHFNLPLTATGIPRYDVQKLGRVNHGRRSYLKENIDDLELYQLCEQIYSGGYTHANRHIVGWLIKDDIRCYDFGSSYPARLLYSKYPRSKFFEVPFNNIDTILKQSDSYAFMIKIIMKNVRLKDFGEPMPLLQAGKCTQILNAVVDNGRVLECAYCEIALTEIDLLMIKKQYYFDYAISKCYCATKDYLPIWFRKYVLTCYKDKSELKGGDPVKYAIAKGKLNSLYGMCVQKNLRELIKEDYESGEYSKNLPEDLEKFYKKYIGNEKQVLPYQWGVWCTAYARQELFKIGQMAEEWLYSDTDSCYLINPDIDAINKYNAEIEHQYKSLGYDDIIIDGKIYLPGKAEPDGIYSEFITLGSKRYACRVSPDKIKLTVAGVPKKGGAEVLKNNLENFKPGLVFPGKITGKKLHTYFFTESIKTDIDGNEIGDSIDLSPCDYLLDRTQIKTWNELTEEELLLYCYD